MEDKADGGSTWKREDPATLAAERAEAEARAAAARHKKLSNRLTTKKQVRIPFYPIAWNRMTGSHWVLQSWLQLSRGYSWHMAVCLHLCRDDGFMVVASGHSAQVGAAVRHDR